MREQGGENRKRRMRIGIFQDAFFPMIDGVVEVVDHYAREMQRYADVTVVVPEVPGEPFDDSALPYRVLRCRALRVPVLDYCLPVPLLDPAFLRKLRAMRFDLVHIHSPFTLGALGVRYAKRRRIPVIGTMHTQFKRDFQRAVKSGTLASLMTRVLVGTFRRCDECWAVNAAMARLYHAEYGYPEFPGVMRNATDMRPVADEAAARRRAEEAFGLGPDEFVLLFVGRLNDLKNVFLIAKSLRYVKERARRPFRMLFIGTGQDERRLRALIRQSGAERETVFAGSVADRELLAAAYARADLMLFPSLYDASSLVQIEAASQGTPALYVRGAVTADTVTAADPTDARPDEEDDDIDLINGFIADNAPGPYAEAILALMGDPECVRAAGENARRDLWVSWEDVMREVYGRYRHIVREYRLKGR
ncbi:MAG: glycosyltransferase [Lachnospiraceae bacterium]|nr:glycosyltransferase [Lachnospiraceae bacterium]